jgi:hypothetical protein
MHEILARSLNKYIYLSVTFAGEENLLDEKAEVVSM